jgi:hypothetical protein
MNAKRSPKARKGVTEELCLEKRKGSGPWDGELNPELGNTCVRRFMRWYRQRLDLSLHQVEALTGINRAYMRRVERKRVHLSLVVLWRWANGLHVNVDWVLRMARLRAQKPA